MIRIKTKDLSVRTQKENILGHIDLQIEDGETVLVCGKPGSGKTILLKTLKGLIENKEEFTVEGEKLVRGNIGIVFQHPEKQIVRNIVFQDVVFELENLGLSRDEIKSKVSKYSELLNAEYLLDRKVNQLSHGEITKVALLSCLVTEPDIILLDEPLSTLDSRNQKLLLESIDMLRETDKTIIIAEHDVRYLLERADKVLLMDDGNLEKIGSPSELVGELDKNGIRIPFNSKLAIRLGIDDVPLSNEREVEFY